ncbi:MAG TPA: hypothetical protein VMU30_10020 [Bacteroidota bacterium]|nr:hypothetical protein [Bacteroidota bacterium]
MQTEKLPYPPEQDGQEQALEYLLLLAKGATFPVPIASFTIEILNRLYKKPLEKRRIDWMEKVTEVINELISKQKDLTPTKLAQNPEFVTILHRATEIAVKTHQEEKHLLLKNAILSAGSPTSTDLDKQLLFLRFVDELSINQVLVLQLYRNPIEWFHRHNLEPHSYYMASRIEALNQAYPELAKDPFLKDLVLSELERRGLLSGLYGNVSESSVYNPATTNLGIAFLTYVQADKIES